MTERTKESTLATRRDFLKATTAVAAGVSLAGLAAHVHAADNDVIKVGLIGCGSRGTGAADDVLHSAKNVHIVALGDVFEDRMNGCRDTLIKAGNSEDVKKLDNKVDLPRDRCFVGLDAFEKVIASGANYIILATPPGFRPLHLQAAVAAGKNIFTEKPVGVDGPGIRKVLEAYEEAKKKNLAIVAGTQRRHQQAYLETVKQIQDGAIGDIVAGRCYWNQGNIWFNERKPNTADLVYQLRNWYHFGWLCGDHIVEQHVHNLDVINWALGQHPVAALGMGGRVRPYNDPNTDGNIYNFFAVDYEYPKGVHVLSQCRQIDGADGNMKGASGVSEALAGTKGHSQVGSFTINDKKVASGKGGAPYVQEHTDLIESIRAGKPLNELKNVAESTLTAILGRMSAYTGKALTWEQMLNSKLDTMPANLAWDMSLPPAPLAVPGKTKFS